MLKEVILRALVFSNLYILVEMAQINLAPLNFRVLQLRLRNFVRIANR